TPHAVLSLRLGSPVRGDDGINWHQVMAQNDGDKTPDSFVWHALIPKGAPIEGAHGQPAEDVTVDGVVYSNYWLRHPLPLPKGEPFSLFALRVKPNTPNAPRSVLIRWYIRSDDGTFPGLNKDGTLKYGRIEIPG